MSYVFDNSASVAFAIIISIFAVSFNFLWQRHELRLQYEWDMVIAGKETRRSIGRISRSRRILRRTPRPCDLILSGV
jgi:hypothetical protein